MKKNRIESLLYSTNSESFRIIDSSGIVSIQKLRLDVEDTISLLNTIEITKNENIGIICDNHSCFVSALFAIISINAVAVPIDPQISSSSLQIILEKFNIRYIFVFGNRAENIFNQGSSYQNLFRNVNGKWFISRDKEWAKKQNEEYLVGDTLSPAIILLTSGTVDLKHKGVLISHQAILNNIESIVEYMKPSNNESIYIAKSLSHISSVIGELIMALYVGMTVYIYNPIVTYNMLIKRLNTCKPDYLVINPTLLHYLSYYAENGSDIYNVKGIYTCGGFASESLIKRARTIFPLSKIYNMYGLTEAGPRVTAQTDNDDNYSPGYAGKAIKNVQIKIMNSNGESCINETGRIHVKSNALMLGYYGDEELTNKKFKDDFLITGDVGFLNEKQELFVSGRADDVIVRSGKNINLNMVEDVISEMKEIKECIVFAIPDEIYQNKIICAYVANEKCVLDIYKAREYCLKKLFPYECPQQFIEYELIPKTHSNKKSRKNAIEIYSQYKE